MRKYFELKAMSSLAELSKLGKEDSTKKLIELAILSDDEELKQNVFEILSLEATPQLVSPDPFFLTPEAEELRGEMKIGHVFQTGDPVYLKLGSLNKNILITGAIGTGKTNLIDILIRGMEENDIPFLVISIAKQDYRHLIRYFPDIKVIRAEKQFKLNLLRPPEGGHPKEGLSDFISAYTYQTDVMMRSKSILVGKVDELLRMFGAYDDNRSDEYPNMEDLEDWLYEGLKRSGPRGDDFLLRNYQRAHMYNTLTDIFKCSSGSDIEWMLSKKVVLELDGLQDDVLNSIIAHLLTWILRYRLIKGQRGKLRHVTIIDECKRVFPVTSERNSLMGIPQIDFLVSYAREFGEGIIAADQEISKLSTNLRANTSTKVAFFTSGADLEETRKTFNLDREKVEVLSELPPGFGIVKMDEGYQKPFIVKFDYLHLVRDVTDEEVDNQSKAFIKRLNRTVKPRSSILMREVKKRKEEKALSKEADAWLRHQARNPNQTIVERTKALGFTNYMANKVTKELEVKGCARKLNVYTGKPGHPLVLTDFTEKGVKYVTSLGEKISKIGKGGLVHRWWQNKVKEFWKARGREVKIEPNVEGANTDVLVMDSDGKRVAIEIALSADNQLKNISRDLCYFDSCVLAAETKLLLMKIKAEAIKLLTKEDLRRVTFCLLGDFLT